jgi:hypothetical protein
MFACACLALLLAVVPSSATPTPPAVTPAAASAHANPNTTPPAAGGPTANQTPATLAPPHTAAALTGMPKLEEIPLYWRTRAERSAFRATADYDETIRFARQLEGGSNWVHVTSYGSSGQGRDLPLIVVSKDRAFTPAAARATGKPIVLIQNGIHAGEIEGKDASLALIRDLAVLRTHAELLDHVILLVMPIFSVDAHERRSAYNRINQNGPDEQGWRFTPIGLNLNRDYLKAESPEMRAMISRVFTQWWPHLLVDDNTTDGADFRHDIGYGMNFGPGAPAPVGRWLTQVFEGRVIPRLASLGHLPSPYLGFQKGTDPLSGVDFSDSPPRYSTGYAAIQCRPGILVETHSLKSYETRVRATYDLLLMLIAEINANPAELTRAVAESESLVIARAHAPRGTGRNVVLNSTASPLGTPFPFKGLERHLEHSEITGADVARFRAAPWDTLIPIFREQLPALTVSEPAGYLVPQEWTTVSEHLDLHAVRYRRFARAWSDTVEVPHVLAVSESSSTFEGHHLTLVRSVALERRLRAYRPGDLWVPLDQRGALVAMHLLESQAPDGLTLWNAFDTVFERHEYAEDYLMEPIAKRMMSEDPRLAAEFRAKLAADTAFAHSPAARLDFFYTRSPWFDREFALLPVTRALRAPPDEVLAP